MTPTTPPTPGGAIETDGDGATRIRVKAVPGASRDQVAGLLGNRLKVRVAAPPEGGKANEAIRKLVAAALGVRPGDIEIVSGRSNANKTLRVVGVTPDRARAALHPNV